MMPNAKEIALILLQLLWSLLTSVIILLGIAYGGFFLFLLFIRFCGDLCSEREWLLGECFLTIIFNTVSR